MNREPVSHEMTRPPASDAGATILLVEDETSVRALVARFLVLKGFQVLTAEHGADALSVWGKHKDAIDLLLTDVVMPGGLNGRALAEQLLAEQPRLKVIYTSGYSEEFLKTESGVGQGIHFVQKPYRPEQLLETLRAALASDSIPAENLC